MLHTKKRILCVFKILGYSVNYITVAKKYCKEGNSLLK